MSRAHAEAGASDASTAAADPAHEPLCKEIVVRTSRERAFAVFTAGIGDWWPLATHSVAGKPATGATFEGRVGGRVFETDVDGAEHLWGTVLTWDPPRGVSFTWHPGREPESAQQVDIAFEPVPEGTRVVLVHRGWAVLGERAAKVRAGYDQGWNVVLGRCYADAATADGA